MSSTFDVRSSANVAHRTQNVELSEPLLPIPRCAAAGCRRRGLIGRGRRDGAIDWWCEFCFSVALVREERS